MPDGTALPHAPADAPASAGEPLRDSQVEALGELVRIGMKIARAIERQVDAAGEGPEAIAELNAAAIAFARVARAVRQTVLLQNRLLEAPASAGAGRAGRAGELRARLKRIVRHAVESEAKGENGDEDGGDAERAERLHAEAAEGLEQERWGDILARPVPEIIDAICQDLGIRPDWRSLADEIADAEAFAQEDLEPDGGPIDICWIGEDGRWQPTSEMFPDRYKPDLHAPSGGGAYDPARDPALRGDTS